MAYIENLPTTVVEDGKEYELFTTGDEFVGYLHDAEGDRIIQADDGKYYYAENDKDGNFVPSNVRVFKPTYNKSRLYRTKSKAKSAHVPDKEVEEIKKKFMEPMGGDYQTKKRAREEKIRNSSPDNAEGGDVNFSSDPLNNPENAPIHIGEMTNLVVYIRFADDPIEFTRDFGVYDFRFNGPIQSVDNYYQTVSYGKAGITSHHFPAPDGNNVMSYQDIYNRNYYQPYNATTNPDGYTSSQRSSREWALLRRAILHIQDMVPVDLNIDKDNNGMVDSVSFIIHGSHGGWASILWAHRWVLGGSAVYINGKRVWDYCFQPETQCTRKILVHELFHVYGAPDLYRYSGGNISPVASWDLMGGGGGHMGAWMKYKYTDGDWIESIPEITSSGYYTINSLHNNSTNNCYKIPTSIDSNEFYLVEYRVNSGDDYEALYGTGLLIYRINPEENGNAGGPPDEVYIYRQNGTLTINGIISRAHHSQLVSRTAIGGEQELKGFLKDGEDGGLNITEITDNQDGTITFYVDLSEVPNIPKTTLNLSTDPVGITTSGSGVYDVNQEASISTTSHSGGNVFQHWRIADESLLYNIPEIPKAEDYANIVYIDPTGTNGDGTIDNPYNSINTLRVNNELPNNTAYLIKNGTQLNERIYSIINSSYIGSYGEGQKAILYGGFRIRTGSSNVVINELDIQAVSPYADLNGNSAIILGEDSDVHTITVANCNIEGVFDDTISMKYPYRAIKGKNHNWTIYNNEISYVYDDGIGMGSGDNLTIVRNKIHHVDMKRVGNEYTDTQSGALTDGSEYNYDCGDGIHLNIHSNLYIAGNHVDRSNTSWKFALILKTPWSHAKKGAVIEHNTFIGNNGGPGGGAVVYLEGPENSTIRNNIFDGTNGGLQIGSTIIYDVSSNIPQQADPYGVYDNIFIRGNTSKDFYIPSSALPTIESNNLMFDGYDDFLMYRGESFSNIESKGSDIFENIEQTPYPIISYNRSTSLKVNRNLSLVAEFEHQTVSLTLSVEPLGKATVHPSGYTTHNYGVVYAIACRNIDEDYQFLHWKRPDNSIYSTSASTMINMVEDVELIAVLEPKEIPNTYNVDVELILI